MNVGISGTATDKKMSIYEVFLHVIILDQLKMLTNERIDVEPIHGVTYCAPSMGSRYLLFST